MDKTVLSDWDSFYVIVGSAAGALIGLQFVAMTLMADRPIKRGAEAGAAFATPTIVHFCVVLLLAALLRVPWPAILPAAICLGVIGFGGTGYVVVVARRMRRQDAYQPEFEDWLFHTILPLVAYMTLALSSLAALTYIREALMGIGGTALLLLLIGIHNSWDAVGYHIFVVRANPGVEEHRAEPSAIKNDDKRKRR
jgi:hypothetical protein